ncbi:MAG TPA: hypothetical protein VII94_05075 [Candidatus Saccharimonadales bacterium]
MNRHEEISQSPEYSEIPVAKRYSFANQELLRLDILSGRGKLQKRFIEYPSPTGVYEAVRQSLISKRLFLGELVPTIGAFDRVKIQNGAKPILHGAMVRTMGDYTYNDINLFTDLGKLLRDFGQSLGKDHPIEFIGHIGLNVALVDYTQRKERGLFLVPGSEYYANSTTKNQNEILNVYLDQLQQEFGVRFTGIEQSFIDGFQPPEK